MFAKYYCYQPLYFKSLNYNGTHKDFLMTLFEWVRNKNFCSLKRHQNNELKSGTIELQLHFRYPRNSKHFQTFSNLSNHSKQGANVPFLLGSFQHLLCILHTHPNFPAVIIHQPHKNNLAQMIMGSKV